ncbi:hypothetical protein EIP86_004374 [Pleurotus ostreatoroseus]|nr:hypothetical protein EIP86_004374 [Pleurotus ostreatoroseus]
MSFDYDLSEARHIPSLVNYCQRGEYKGFGAYKANPNLLSTVSGIGKCQNLYYSHYPDAKLIPLEELWKALCFRDYSRTAEQHYIDEDPESWRDAYFELRDLEKQRFTAVGNKLRSQREEEEQRRKDSQVKFTDRLPPVKRSRGWGTTQPKTLFQKTRSDAVKKQKGIYGAPIPVPPAKTLRICKAPNVQMFKPPASATSSTSSSTTGTRVTVTALDRWGVIKGCFNDSHDTELNQHPSSFGITVSISDEPTRTVSGADSTTTIEAPSGAERSHGYYFHAEASFILPASHNSSRYAL